MRRYIHIKGHSLVDPNPSRPYIALCSCGESYDIGDIKGIMCATYHIRLYQMQRWHHQHKLTIRLRKSGAQLKRQKREYNRIKQTESRIRLKSGIRRRIKNEKDC